MARKRKSQVEKVRDFLFTGKKLTAKTAISRFGIYRLAAVIYVLRNTFNMHITTDNTKGYAVYSLATS